LPQAPIEQIISGENLFIALYAPGVIHWSIDDWQNAQDTVTSDSGLDMHFAQIPTRYLRPGQQLDFTFHNTETADWAGQDYHIIVAASVR
jgi:hypothetical protein